MWRRQVVARAISEPPRPRIRHTPASVELRRCSGSGLRTRWSATRFKRHALFAVSWASRCSQHRGGIACAGFGTTRLTRQRRRRRTGRLRSLLRDGIGRATEVDWGLTKARTTATLGRPAALAGVWPWTSIDSDEYCWRANQLRKTGWRSGLSCEPMLGPSPGLNSTGIDWVIEGGESGHGSLPIGSVFGSRLARSLFEGSRQPVFQQVGGARPSACLISLV
ncbi:DUF5131 family protein [Nocardia sp. NPDC049220]|uniref:DUF5131 family protein n=1 Tax=Nocardia sp. NPDC049220 TaxID=3155273 RepID=UPI0033FFED76